jgi:membrane associated rhomboid family serine protease
MFKLNYNAPVTLTFTILSALILLVDEQALVSGIVDNYFTGLSSFDYDSFKDYWCLISFPLGNENWNQFFENITYILLLGPIIEEKYGTGKLSFMIIFTSIICSILNIIFFNTDLIGATSIVFMFIILASITELKQNTIPLTFLLVVIIFLGREISDILNTGDSDGIVQLVGGVSGAVCGFFMMRK